MTITNQSYVDAFTNGGTGGLLSQVLSPWKGGGKFILFLLALSVMYGYSIFYLICPAADFVASANNIPDTYSAGLSMQALGRPFAKIPRFFWTVLCFIIYLTAGLAGREHFSAILSNFLSILSYWTSFFIVILAEEHFIFRRRNGALGGYNLNDWDSPKKFVSFLSSRIVD